MTKFKDIKLIALDLDETTLNEHGRLTERTRNAILAAIKKGIHIVIASGRAYTALPREVLDIVGIEYAITSNGAAMYRVSDNRCMLAYKLNAGSVKRALEVKKHYNVTFETFIDGFAYANSAYIQDPTAFGAPEKAKKYLVSTRKPVDDIEGFMLEHSSELDSIDIVVPSLDVRDKITTELREADSEVYVTSSVRYLVEIANKKAGKGEGLKYIADLLGIELANCAAFGNADNDIDMLVESGVGIAVENATQNCLAKADITAPPHTKDGVAEIIEQIVTAQN